MKVDIVIDPACTEPQVTIRTAAMTEEVTALVNQLSAAAPAPITGVKDEKLILLSEEEIIRVYAQEGKVFATTP